ncbi:MAG: SGNH/GDSL hydrolase family protein [Patescibacteria group bacterium]
MSETKKRWLTLIISVLLTLVAIECILHLFETQTYVSIWRINKDGMAVLKPNLDRNLFDNEELKYFHVKSNSLGFLGDDFSEEKASGTLRIVVLGDSYVEATGVDYNRTFVYQLSKKFQDLLFTNPSSTYNKVEVLNFGIGGTGTVDQMKYYEKYAQKYHPDVVVLAFYLQNDATDNSYSYKYKDAMLASKESWNTFPQYASTQINNFVSVKDRIYRMSAIIRFFDRIVRGSPVLYDFAVKFGLYRPPAKGENGLVIPYDDYYYITPLDEQRSKYLQFSIDLLDNLKKQLDKDGVKFALMFIPQGMTVDKNVLNSYLDQYPGLKNVDFNPKAFEDRLIAGLDPSIKMINLRETMEKEVSDGKEMYKNGWGHFSQGGHDVVSDVLAKFIFDSFYK